MTWSDYFLRRAEESRHLPVLTQMPAPCGDCAVECGLYTEISEALALEPVEIQEAVSGQWFCHNASDRACRGNIDLLAARRVK